MATATTPVVVILGDREPKKHSVKYNSAPDDLDAALTSVYVSKVALAQLGDPERVKVTIEPA